MNGLPEKMTLSLKSIKKNNYDFPKEKWDGYLVMYNDFSLSKTINHQSINHKSSNGIVCAEPS